MSMHSLLIRQRNYGATIIVMIPPQYTFLFMYIIASQPIAFSSSPALQCAGGILMPSGDCLISVHVTYRALVLRSVINIVCK